MKKILSKDHMRRNLQRYSKFNITGFFKTRKGKFGDNWIFFESYLEYDHLNMFEYNPAVKLLESQPVSINYMWRGRKHFYTADVGTINISKTSSSVEYKEIKPSSALEDDKESDRFEKIKSVYAQAGYPFEVITEKDLLPEQSLNNLEILNKSLGGLDGDSPLIDDALTVLSHKITLGESLQVFDALSLDTRALSYLLYNQLYQFDLKEPLNTNTLLTRNIT